MKPGLQPDYQSNEARTYTRSGARGDNEINFPKVKRRLTPTTVIT